MKLGEISAGMLFRGVRNPDSLLPLPSNLLVDGLYEEYAIDNLRPGRYLVYVLAGRAKHLLDAIDDTYQLSFRPRAMAIAELEVAANEQRNHDFVLDIDLRHVGRAIDVVIASCGIDPRTMLPLPNRLILPMVETSKGLIFTDVDTSFNIDPELKKTRQRVFFDDAIFARRGLSSRTSVLSISGRKTVHGFDLPGISMIVNADFAHLFDEVGSDSEKTPSEGQTEASVVVKPNAVSLTLPKLNSPAVALAGSALDTTGGVLSRGGEVAWTKPTGSDLMVLHFNYLTAPPQVKVFNAHIGGSTSHVLWEVYVSAEHQRWQLPVLLDSAPNYPVLYNPDPNLGSKLSNYHYGPKTIEIELQAVETRKRDFEQLNLIDLNSQTLRVSQDAFVVTVE